MRLGEIIPAAAGASESVEILDLCFDNRKVRQGSLFFCVPGFSSDGHDFAADAVVKGAAALVVERPLGLGVPEVLVESVRAEMGPAADRFHGHPSSAIDVIGVTGTNGKTTVTWLVRSLLEAAGRDCGVIGTVSTVVGGAQQGAVRTTPEAIELQDLFAQMARAGDSAAAIEVSSHALELGRVDGTDFAAAVFTNLTQDHLDFHGTMENYWTAKRQLFTRLKPRASIIDVDDSHGRSLARELGSAVTTGIEQQADWRAVSVETGLSGSSFTLICPEGEYAVSTPLAGRFNVRNLLGAAAAVRSLGVEIEAILAGIESVQSVPGRFQPIDRGQPFAVLVDYAHTPDSLENVLTAARGIASGKVICVVGCGGDRDSGKRPQMGRIASTLADRVVITSDNPRSEDPQAIITQIAEGLVRPAEQIVDRAEAIEAAISAASEGDVVLIAGKGHERGQEFADGVVVAFDDSEVAAAALERRQQR